MTNYWLLEKKSEANTVMKSITNSNTKGTTQNIRYLLVTAILCCCFYSTTSVININTVMGCLPREYKFNATKTVESNGVRLTCWDVVTVYSCWGRCDSFEYGNYKMPYKISYHPVCTYTGKVARQVRLRHCHPEFPDPFYEVFDASGCGCKVCDSEHTSCENLNG